MIELVYTKSDTGSFNLYCARNLFLRPNSMIWTAREIASDRRCHCSDHKNMKYRTFELFPRKPVPIKASTFHISCNSDR